MATNGIDYKRLAVYAKLGEELINLALASGLLVMKQKPGRKAAPVEKPAKAAKTVKAPKAAPPPESYDAADDDE